MTRVLVIGADERAVRAALTKAGPDDDVVVVDPSAERLEQLYEACQDARLWLQIGDEQVVPLPDASVDRALGGESDDLDRVLR